MEASAEPTSVRIRKLPPWVIAVHTEKAKASGMSLEGYLRQLLEVLALEAQHTFAHAVAQQRVKIKIPSTDLLESD